MQNVNKVLYTQDQSEVFSTEQKAVARNNIGAQEQLTAGSGISISGNEISCTVSPGPTYTAGANVSIGSDNVISATDTTYTAGANVSIDSSNVISATDTTYTAGTNVSINSSNVISATDTTYTAGTNVSIDNNNVISATDTTYNVFNTSTDGLVPKANGTGDTGKFLRGDHTWQYPATGSDGDANHPNYITQDSGGQLHYLRAPRLFWNFTYNNPSIELTATDITNGYAEFVFVLGTEGLAIAETGNIVAIKGYDISMGNSLNGKQMSFYLVNHGGGSPRMLMDTGFQTYTESVVNNYDWKAFKAIGLTANRNVSKLDAVLRVPLSASAAAGATLEIPGHVTVTIFGIATNDVPV